MKKALLILCLLMFGYTQATFAAIIVNINAQLDNIVYDPDDCLIFQSEIRSSIIS